MNRNETIALFEACEAKRTAALGAGKSEDEAHEAAKAHWNAWAEPLLVDRKAMEASGAWKSERKYPWMPERGEYAETQAWLEKAAADFSRCLFLFPGVDGIKETAGEDKVVTPEDGPPVKSIKLEGKSFRFNGFVFPSYANFRSATFTGRAGFESATFTGRADFGRAIFSDDADFGWATFSGTADFRSATFTGRAGFESAIFTGDAGFESATFTGDAGFRSATFTGRASFASASFTGLAGFRGQTFTNDVFFNGAKFGPKETADFGLATFERVVQFDGAKFKGEADFGAVWGKRTFSMAGARFESMPDFIQAHFEEAPRLDNVVVAGRLLPPHEEKLEEGEELWQSTREYRKRQSKSYTYRRVTGGIPMQSELRDMPARWRALKRLAIQGHDTDRELQFFSEAENVLILRF